MSSVGGKWTLASECRVGLIVFPQVRNPLMLNCRNCKCQIENRLAHQSYYDLENTLVLDGPGNDTQHKVRMLGPLCDACLADWHASRARPMDSQVVATP